MFFHWKWEEDEKSGILMTRLPFILVFMIPVSVYGSRRVRSTWPFYYEEAGVCTLSFLMSYDSLGKKKDNTLSLIKYPFCVTSSLVFGHVSKDNPDWKSLHDMMTAVCDEIHYQLDYKQRTMSCSLFVLVFPPSYNLIIIAFRCVFFAIKWFYVSMAWVDQNEIPFTLIH